jgi:hypothetical protein
MALTAASEHRRDWTLAWAGRLPLGAWCALGVALFAALVFSFDPSRLSTSLGDTDDATRLVEVRELLGGAPWYDTTLPRFGGFQPLVSHWSRLIDLPLAALLSALELILPPEEAELAVRALWPLLVLAAFVYLMAREVELRGGRAAALLAIPLTVTCLIGIVQFLPGRIDHHNVIILCAVIGILRLARSFDDPSAGWSAGCLLGLGTAVGYEALALTTASLGAAMLFGALPRHSLLGPSRAAVTFAATLTIALALTTASDALFVSRCDALSFNLVLLSATGALVVSLVQAAEERLSSVTKIALLAAGGLAGLTLYAFSEPACLSGPFGQVDRALFPVWLGRVSETQSIVSMGAKLPHLGGMALVYFLIGGYCGLRLLQTERNDDLRFHMLVLLIAIPLSFWQIKLIPYATYLPIPLLAVWLARPPQQGNAHASNGAIAAIVLGVLVVIACAGWLLLSLAEPSARRFKEAVAPNESCESTAAIAPLARLPKGLAVADVNLGPYLVALTHLDVLAAPYHRLDRQILEADRILHGPPQEAKQRLGAIGARYVVTCKGLDSTAPQSPVPADALQSLLNDGEPPEFLEPVPLDAPTPLKVWRVKP